MLELIQITNDPVLAQRCDALGGFRLLVDLERLGKAERQAGKNSFISEHQLADIAPIRAVLRRSRLMVRVNPWHEGSARELEAVLREGPDCVMLPMFTGGDEVRAFARLVAGRVPIVALLETAPALESLEGWLDTPGLEEVYVGLNDLHLSLGMHFMFEPLADGRVEQVAQAVHRRGLGFGFGGISRMAGGMLPGRDVLAEHVRLGSSAVILSRSFHKEGLDRLEAEVAALREAEALLARRSAEAMQADARRIAATIREIAGRLARGDK